MLVQDSFMEIKTETNDDPHKIRYNTLMDVDIKCIMKTRELDYL